jgi:hypothetical protein
VIHLTAGGLRVESVRSHLSTAGLAKLMATGARPAGPPPLPKAQPGAAIEAGRVVSKDGQVHAAGRYVIAAQILGGRRAGVRIEENTLMFLSAVSPAAIVVLAQSAVFRVREKTTLRPAFRIGANGWSVAVVMDPAMAS